MNFHETRKITERGTNMKRTHLIAVLLGLAAMGIFTPDASAYYNPCTGAFMSRDPGAGSANRIGTAGPALAGGFIPMDQYSDGMNLYQYVGNAPIRYVDPTGLAAVSEPSPTTRTGPGSQPAADTGGGNAEVAVHNGKFVVTIKAYVAGKEYGAFCGVEFVPNAKVCPKCKLIRLIQVTRGTYSSDAPYVWTGDEADHEKGKTREDKKSGIEGSWSIDYRASDCTEGKPCSLYYRDYWPVQGTHDGSTDGSAAVSASLGDRPIGPAGFKFEFETCARCADDGNYYGCVKWGFASTDKDPPGPPTHSPISASDRPTATFNEAVRVFNQFYKNPT